MGRGIVIINTSDRSLLNFLNLCGISLAAKMPD